MFYSSTFLVACSPWLRRCCTTNDVLVYLSYTLESNLQNSTIELLNENLYKHQRTRQLTPAHDYIRDVIYVRTRIFRITYSSISTHSRTLLVPQLSEAILVPYKRTSRYNQCSTPRSTQDQSSRGFGGKKLVRRRLYRVAVSIL